LWHNQNWRWLLVRSLQQVLLERCKLMQLELLVHCKLMRQVLPERCKLMQLVLLVLVQHNYRKMSHWRVVRSNLP